MSRVSTSRVRYARCAASLACAATVGALLFSVRIATTVFQELPTDRLTAGRIAGRAFTGSYAIALVAAIAAIVVVVTTRSRRGALDAGLAGTMLSTALLQLFWIAPAILHHGQGWPGSFASLHAAGGGLHLLLAVLALILAWRLLETRADSDDPTFA